MNEDEHPANGFMTDKGAENSPYASRHICQLAELIGLTGRITQWIPR